ncbi:MAG: porin family protein [Nitrosomonas sp. PRO4]|nr:porin family protein [Nitrosomonas sp. PRO4]
MKVFPRNQKLAFNFILGTSLILTTAVVPTQVYANDANQRIKQLERALQEIQSELQRIKSDSAQTTRKVDQIQETSTQTTRKVEQIQETTQRVEQNQKERIAASGTTFSGMSDKRTMLFFRGGYARSDQTRNGVSIESRVAPVGAQERADRDAWYVGAGFDFQLTKDTWGLIPKTEIDAELMFEYKQFAHGVPGSALANEPTQLAGGALNPRGVTVSQFTLSAAPKIKFNHFAEYKIRPWIIPAGLAIHVVSPPTESITVLDPGIMFAGGFEYNVWRDFFIGVDARYQLLAGSLDGTKFSGMTAGGYIGIGF